MSLLRDVLAGGNVALLLEAEPEFDYDKGKFEDLRKKLGSELKRRGFKWDEDFWQWIYKKVKKNGKTSHISKGSQVTFEIRISQMKPPMTRGLMSPGRRSFELVGTGTENSILTDRLAATCKQLKDVPTMIKKILKQVDDLLEAVNGN